MRNEYEVSSEELTSISILTNMPDDLTMNHAWACHQSPPWYLILGTYTRHHIGKYTRYISKILLNDYSAQYTSYINVMTIFKL